MKKQWNIINKCPSSENMIENILTARGILDIKHFLNPIPSDLIPIDKLINMDKSVEIITEGIKDNKRFTIFYDAADVDGIASGTIMRKYLANFTDKVEYVFGLGKKHGLKCIDLDKVIEITDILIIVDSSTGDHEQQNYLQSNGVTVIIYDHHPEPINPNVCTVSSQYLYPNSQLSGSGVTWKACLALDNALGTNYALDYIDLAAIGILADVSSIGEKYMENRLLVSLGMKNLKNTAIKIILGSYDFNSQSVLFSIAPLINSSARLSKNQLVIDFMMEDDKKKAKKLYNQLVEIKEEQKILVDIATKSLTEQIEKQDYVNNKVVYGFVNVGELTGLIGSKLCEAYGKPAIILKTPIVGASKLTGSIRAVGIDNFKSLINNSGLGKAYGHESAAGVFIQVDSLQPLLEKLNEVLKDVEFKTEEDIDIQLEPEEITTELIKQMEKVNRLTGKDFKPITVYIEGVEPQNVSNMKAGQHTKFDAEDLECIKWNSQLHEDLKYTKGIYNRMDIFGTLTLGNFRGVKTKQVIIQDTRNLEQNLEFFR